MQRVDGRAADVLRPVSMARNYLKFAEGSALIEFGDTRVLCSASVEEKVPPFLKGSGSGWVTAEYSLLPRSTGTRNAREAAKGKLTGRTHEIQRLDRAFPAKCGGPQGARGERTIWIDCDVIQADGGTRTGCDYRRLCRAWWMRWSKWVLMSACAPFLCRDFLAAVSVGILAGGAGAGPVLYRRFFRHRGHEPGHDRRRRFCRSAGDR